MAVLVLLGLVVIAVWAGSLYLFPFGPCMSCKGSGRNAGSSSKRYGECRRCKGSGRRRRVGARVVHRGAVSIAEKAKAKKSG